MIDESLTLNSQLNRIKSKVEAVTKRLLLVRHKLTVRQQVIIWKTLVRS